MARYCKTVSCAQSSVETAALLAIAYLGKNENDNSRSLQIATLEAEVQKLTIEPENASLPISSKAIDALLQQKGQ